MRSKKQVQTHSQHTRTLEKIRELYKFAEFGRLSSGLFHDIINPLTAIVLNIEQARSNHTNIPKVKKYLDQACGAARHMERFVVAIKQQLHDTQKLAYFCPCAEIYSVGNILSHKARTANVRLEFSLNATVPLFGNSTYWTQIILNIISNAIDAYDNSHKKSIERVVTISCNNTPTLLCCSISDHGTGIARCHVRKIFNAFFSTKLGCIDKGTGVGLSIAKHLLEKEFNGTITVKSTRVSGTTFTLSIPVHRKL